MGEGNATEPVRRSENNSMKLILSFYLNVGSRKRTLVFRFTGSFLTL